MAKAAKGERRRTRSKTSHRRPTGTRRLTRMSRSRHSRATRLARSTAAPSSVLSRCARCYRRATRRRSPHASTNVRPDYVVARELSRPAGRRLSPRIDSSCGSPGDPLGAGRAQGHSRLRQARRGQRGGARSNRRTPSSSPSPSRLKFVAGPVQAPFSTLELDPIARYELTPISVKPMTLLKDLGYAGRDLGAGSRSSRRSTESRLSACD